jgi:hypothetical protein
MPLKPIPKKLITPKTIIKTPPNDVSNDRYPNKNRLSAVALAPNTTIVVANPRKKAIDIIVTRSRFAWNVKAKYAGRMGNVHGERKLNKPARNVTGMSNPIPLLVGVTNESVGVIIRSTSNAMAIT